MTTRPIDIDEGDLSKIREVGYDLDVKDKSGTFMLRDENVLQSQTWFDGVELMPLADALAGYDWLREIAWTLVDPDKDDKTRAIKQFEDEHGANGMFIRVKKGAKINMPLQSCFYIKEAMNQQKAHNIIYLEDDSELHVINGCASSIHAENAQHWSVTETFVGKNATLTFTMIHAWGPEIETYPRSGALVEEGGLYVSNYISLREAKYVEMYPYARLVGKGANARFYSVILAPPGADLDLGGRAYLDAPDTGAEVINRTVSTGGHVINRGHLVGGAKDAHGFMECNAIIVGEGLVHAIPELEGRLEDLALNHEAAVGRISQEEIDYLRTRGFTEEQARALIITGFLNVSIKGLPAELQEQIAEMIEMAAKGM